MVFSFKIQYVSFTFLHVPVSSIDIIEIQFKTVYQLIISERPFVSAFKNKLCDLFSVRKI
jgi:hypothetical protein